VEREVRYLSGGNQQKVLLAKWLARRPRILIVDEPTRGVDVGSKADIYRILRDLAASGIALLVVSSDLPEVLALAHRIVVMSEGRVRGELDAASASEIAILELAAPRSQDMEQPAA
jgi:L-arabinose transport system ATP-binding protein